MEKLLILLMLVCGCGFGQSRPAAKKKAEAPAARWPIESLAVEGNHNYTREQVLAVTGLKVGQVASKAEFEAARDRLVASGAFETVGYKFVAGTKGKGYAATFQVSEVEQAYPVQFEELKVSQKDLESALAGKDPLFSMAKLPATQPVLERYVKWIQELLASKGVPEKVAGSVTAAGPGEFMIVFRPARNLPAVAQVTFRGNRVVPQNVLRDAIAGVAIGLPYTEDRFREVLNNAIRPVYEMRGRVRVAFPEIQTEPAKDVQGVHVFVTVDEGQSYELGKVGIDGPSPVQPDVLLKAGDFKTGDIANFDRVNQGLERIRLAMRRAGYLEAKVTTERKINDDKKAVDVAVHIDAGPQFTMGKLNIVGLDLNGEFEIKRIWTMKEGKPFNAEYPESFLNRVREEGLFENLGKTKSEFKINDRDHTADVTLTFAGENPEQKPGKRGRGRGED
ncbi:MAG: POTRA domain-containing protein [Bryobacteraceae bacterium]